MRIGIDIFIYLCVLIYSQVNGNSQDTAGYWRGILKSFAYLSSKYSNLSLFEYFEEVKIRI